MASVPRLRRLARFPSHLQDEIWTHVATIFEQRSMSKQDTEALSAVLSRSLGSSLTAPGDKPTGLWLFRTREWYVACVLRSNQSKTVAEVIALHKPPKGAPRTPTAILPEPIGQFAEYLGDLVTMTVASLRYSREELGVSPDERAAARAIDHTRFVTKSSPFAYLETHSEGENEPAR